MMAETTLTITHAGGLHLRAAARFVQTAAQFASAVRLRNASRPGTPVLDAKSLLGIMQSGVAQGQQVWIGADGSDADAALEALRLLVEHDFEGS